MVSLFISIYFVALIQTPTHPITIHPSDRGMKLRVVYLICNKNNSDSIRISLQKLDLRNFPRGHWSFSSIRLLWIIMRWLMRLGLRVTRPAPPFFAISSFTGFKGRQSQYLLAKKSGVFVNQTFIVWQSWIYFYFYYYLASKRAYIVTTRLLNISTAATADRGQSSVVGWLQFKLANVPCCWCCCSSKAQERGIIHTKLYIHKYSSIICTE